MVAKLLLVIERIVREIFFRPIFSSQEGLGWMDGTLRRVSANVTSS